MGDDIVQYRARIGTFCHGCHSNKTSYCSRNSTSVDISDLILCVFGVIEFIRILLVINGVEQNPGPTSPGQQKKEELLDDNKSLIHGGCLTENTSDVTHTSNAAAGVLVQQEGNIGSADQGNSSLASISNIRLSSRGKDDSFDMPHSDQRQNVSEGSEDLSFADSVPMQFRESKAYNWLPEVEPNTPSENETLQAVCNVPNMATRGLIETEGPDDQIQEKIVQAVVNNVKMTKKVKNMYLTFNKNISVEGSSNTVIGDNTTILESDKTLGEAGKSSERYLEQHLKESLKSSLAEFHEKTGEVQKLFERIEYSLDKVKETDNKEDRFREIELIKGYFCMVKDAYKDTEKTLQRVELIKVMVGMVKDANKVMEKSLQRIEEQNQNQKTIISEFQNQTKETIVSEVQNSQSENKKDFEKVLKAIREQGTAERSEIVQASIGTWEKEDIYLTKSIEVTRDKILEENCVCVCVVGLPKSGKSTAIHRAALHLIRKGFEVFHGEDFMKSYNRNKQQAFIWENVLGRNSIKPDAIEFWTKHDKEIQNILDSNTKLIVSMRTQLYNQAKTDHDFVFLDESKCIDFSDDTLRLDLHDMQGMLYHFLSVNDISNTEDIIGKLPFPSNTTKKLKDTTKEKKRDMTWEASILEFSNCFPLLCTTFCRRQSLRQNPRDFFINPFQAVIKIFEEMKSNSVYQYCGLVLCAVFDGKLHEDVLSFVSQMVEEVDKDAVCLRNAILSSCNLGGPFDSISKIKSALNSLDGVYVKYINSTYTMSHAVYRDVVIYLFDGTHPQFILKYGTREFIRDNIILSQSQSVNSPYMVAIDDDKNIRRLADRLCRDFRNETEIGARFITCNPNINDDILVSCLRDMLCDNDHETQKHMVVELFRQCMLTVHDSSDRLNQGDVIQYKIIQLCLHQGDECDTNMLITDSYYPLHISVKTGDLRLIQLLLDHGADMSKKAWGGNSILHLVCMFAKRNKLEMIQLFKQGEDANSTHLSNSIVNHVNDEGRTILHYLVDDYSITKYLLSLPQIKQVINHRDKEGNTAYWYVKNNKKVTLKGEMEHVEVVVKNDILKLYENVDVQV